MSNSEVNSYSYLMNCYQRGISRKDPEFDAYQYLKQYGAVGIKQYFVLAEELARANTRFELLNWYSGWMKDFVLSGWTKEYTKQMCDCFSSKSLDLASFLHNACVRPSVLLLEDLDMYNPETAKTTLWAVSLEEGRFFEEKHVQKVVRLIKTSLLSENESLKKAAYDCGIAISLPDLLPTLVELILDKSQYLKYLPDLRELFKILLHTLWWPGPNWEPNTFVLRGSVRLIIDKLQNYPVSVYSANRLKLELEKLERESGNSRKALTTNWALEERFTAANTQLIVSDAFFENFIKLHRWVDRTIISGSFAGELVNMIRIVVVKGGDDKLNRGAMANFLAEIESYVHMRNPRGLPVDFDY